MDMIPCGLVVASPWLLGASLLPLGCEQAPDAKALGRERAGDAGEIFVERIPAPRDAAWEAPETDAQSRDPHQEPRRARSQFRLATWNLGVFGPGKASRPDDVHTISEILSSYDLVAVQELKDSSGNSAQVLKQAVEKDSSMPFAGVVSERSGRQADDTLASQEQYAFFFRKDLFEVVGPEPRLFDDNDSDYFQREPQVAKFRYLGQPSADFVLVNIHVAPAAAVSELRALHWVVDWAAQVFEDEDVIVLGDFNAGCDFVLPEQLAALPLRDARFEWLVPDDADTNHFAWTACAYDRVVMTRRTQKWLIWVDWGVDHPFTDRRISDHWPVWVRFSL